MAADYPDLIWRGEAVEMVRTRATNARATQSTVTRSLDRATGHHLAAPIDADCDLPNADIATMDGYAIDTNDSFPLSVESVEIFPEDEPPALTAGTAMEIATGAPLPAGANAVLKRELAEVENGTLRGPSLEPGTYTYERGSNVAEGERLFERGERLRAKDAIFLADLGYEEVEVSEPFSVAILATGTEIYEGEQTDLDSPMLTGLIRQWGHKPTYVGSVPDERGVVRDRINELAGDYDVVLTTGGTSVGHKDHVISSLQELGTIHFHRVRLRPGKPIAMATIRDGTTAFAIPGKPVGAYTISTLVMRSFFTTVSSLPTIEATIATALGLGAEGFEYAIPVTVTDGVATPLGSDVSSLHIYEGTFDPSVLSSSTRATRADGFILRTEPIEADEVVDVIPYSVVE